jgi:ABC-type multidrug transport system fused ATPase/permease subunit
MDKTLGAESVIDSSNIALLVEEMKRALVAEERAKAAADIKRVQRAAREQTVSLEKRAAEMSDTASGLEASLENERASRERTERGAIDSIIRRVNRSARRQRLALTLLALVVVIVAEMGGMFGSGFAGIWLYMAVALVVLVALCLFFRDKISERFLDPVFRGWDERRLEKECQDADLNFDFVLRRLQYHRGQFTFCE